MEISRAKVKAAIRSLQRTQKVVDERLIGQVIDAAPAVVHRIFDSPIGWIRYLGQYVKLIQWYLVDWWNGRYQADWKKVAALGAALIYIVNPVDVIPDLIPVVGWADDMAVLMFILAQLDSELDRYVEVMEIDTAGFDAIYEAQ